MISASPLALALALSWAWAWAWASAWASALGFEFFDSELLSFDDLLFLEVLFLFFLFLFSAAPLPVVVAAFSAVGFTR